MRTEPALLEAAIDDAYEQSGNTIGWRLLSSPAATLRDAQIAFIGLNPGGRVDEKSHPRFAMSMGSAYETESWGNAPPGQSGLQRQVCGLFQRLRVKPEAVLSGNLVPFRSPSWADLPNKTEALLFGSDIWTNILRDAKPKLVIGMSRPVEKWLSKILGVTHQTRVSVGWGKVTGLRGEYEGGVLVGLPHLSRFPIIGRARSEPGLSTLFGPDWS